MAEPEGAVGTDGHNSGLRCHISKGVNCLKKFLKSPWATCLGGAFLGFIFSLIHDCVNGKQLFSTIHSFSLGVYNCIVTCLTATFRVAVWQILLGAFVIIICRIVTKKAIQLRSETMPDDTPEFLAYTTGRFQHWKWSWTWEKNSYKNAWQVKNLRAHCPRCDTTMLHGGFGDFRCPRCGFESDYVAYDIPQDVEAVIYDNVKRKIYKE